MFATFVIRFFVYGIFFIVVWRACMFAKIVLEGFLVARSLERCYLMPGLSVSKRDMVLFWSMLSFVSCPTIAVWLGYTSFKIILRLLHTYNTEVCLFSIYHP